MDVSGIARKSAERPPCHPKSGSQLGVHGTSEDPRMVSAPYAVDERYVAADGPRARRTDGRNDHSCDMLGVDRLG